MRKNKRKPALNTTWFEENLKKTGLSQKEIAHAFDVDPAAIVMIKRGTRKLKAEEVAKLAGLFGVSTDEVLAQTGLFEQKDAKSKSLITISGSIDLDLNILPLRPVEGQTRPKAPNLPGLIPVGDKGEIKVLRFETAGTGRDSLDGALAYYKVSLKIDTEGLGKLCVVVFESGKAGVRVVRKGYEAGTFNLFDLRGQKLEDSARLKSISPILWLKF